jgi:O-antigen/teichoic acid export membrane protein
MRSLENLTLEVVSYTGAGHVHLGAYMTKKGASSLGTDIIIAVGISYFGYIATFLSSIITARLLGPDGKGLYSLFIETSFGLVLFSSLGVGNGMLYQASRNSGYIKHFIANSLIFSLTVALGSAVLYYVIGFISNFKVVYMLGVPGALIGIVIVPVISMTTFQRQYLLALRSYRMAKLNWALTAVIPMMLYIFLYLTNRKEINNILIAYLIAKSYVSRDFKITLQGRRPPEADFLRL